MRFFSLFNIWNLKDELLALILALRNPKTPFASKLFAVASILYLLSPFDIMADVVPFFGILDDLILVPLGAWLTKQNIPDDIMQAAREEAKGYDGFFKKLVWALIIVLLIWIAIAAGLVVLFVRLLLS